MDLIELWFKMKQIKQGIFVHQAKYTKDLMKKFNMVELKPVSTPMSSTTLLGPDEDGEAVDQRVQEHDRLPPVPHSDTTGHSASSSLDLVGFFNADFANYGID
jgi:hypothetical protein